MEDTTEHPDLPQPPRRRSRRWFLGVIAAAGAAAGAAALWVRGCGDAVPPDMDLADTDPRQEGRRDLTFFVTADTHFGVDGIVKLNRMQIEAMNALGGTPFPASLGGRVGRPAEVLIAGDLTQDATSAQWERFVEHYGLTGRDGSLKYPVRECSGNHDRSWSGQTAVESGIQRRHGSDVRGWVRQGVCFFCLGCYPDAAACRWLRRQLETVGRRCPAVVYFHYNIIGPLSDYWSDSEKQAFAEVIGGRNILGIFHGHDHASGHYTWKGFDVYNVGSPRGLAKSFAVVHITDRQMTVASRSWDPSTPAGWSWTHRKSVAWTHQSRLVR